MAEFKPPATQEEYDRNFAQLKPVMTPTQAYLESSRCLFCYDAPCIKACPTGIDIPLFIRQIHSGNLDGAAKTIYESNYLGNACGKVCPTEVLCEGACVYTESDAKAIEIGRLQTYATNQAIQSDKTLFRLAESTGRKVAVIGAGPAGLACACELSLHGISVDIYEAREKSSGLISHGVAPYKITNEEAWAETDYLQRKFGFQVFYGHPVVSREDLQNLEDRYDAIFLGIGLGGTSKLHIPGEDLQNVWGAVEFIEMLRDKKNAVRVPGRVVVLGGGNTAMDAASESARMGASEVTLAYRRGKEGMGAYEFEYDLAKSVGVKGLFYAAPVEIVGSEGTVSGVKFRKTEEVNGTLEHITETDFIIACDWVIKATGQAKQEAFLSQIKNLELDRSGRIRLNAENFQTGNPKYFAAGDAVSGGEEVVNAAADGKNAAKGIISCLIRL
jgi:dihydropyrimidine dehydrogenase (NAD+) subunit PreT